MKKTLCIALASLFAAGMAACKKSPGTEGRPTVVTGIVYEEASPVVVVGSQVTSEGDSPVKARGVCWGQSPKPNIIGSKTIDGTGTGTFSSALGTLQAGSTWYVRAYATNDNGTAYGEEYGFFIPNEQDMDVIVYTENVTSGSSSYSNICAVKPDGSDKKMLYNGAQFSSDDYPVNRGVLNPDGTKLALQGGDYLLWEYDIAAGTRTSVLGETTGVNVDEMVYHPAGGKLLYINWGDESQDGVLETIGTDGSNRTPLTLASAYNLGRPNYTPNGNKIVAANGTGGGGYICTFNADGTSGTRIFTATPPEFYDCPFPVENTRIIYVHYTSRVFPAATGCTICVSAIGGGTSDVLAEIGDYFVDYLSANKAGTKVAYKLEGALVVRPYTGTALGTATILPNMENCTRFRFGRIRKDVFNAAQDM